MMSEHTHRLAWLWPALRHRPSALVGVVILITLATVGLLAPLLAPYDPTALVDQARLPPSGQHWLGTDNTGRDVLSRLLYSIRLALWGGVLSLAITFSLGTVVGMIAGYHKFLRFIMRLVDLWLAIPNLLFLLVVATLLGRETYAVIVAIGLLNIPAYTRIIYTQTIEQKEKPYIMAARALGVSHLVIMWRHILRNILPPIAPMLAIYFSGTILAISSVGFLGIGTTDPSIPELGALLAEGYKKILSQWWLILGPLVMLALVALGTNLVSDGLVETR